MVHVIQKNVVEGQYIEEGQPMFVIADLSHVWIRAKVYEDDIAVDLRWSNGGSDG